MATSLAIGSGASVGREGPLVQVGAAVGSVVGQWFSLPPHLLSKLVGCGAAGAIAAAFHTPITGVLFALEIILNEFEAESFSLIVISSVTAASVSRLLLGENPAFSVPAYSLSHPSELLNYLILGVAAGFLGLAFEQMLKYMSRSFRKLPLPALGKPVLGTLLMAGLVLPFPQLLGVGYDVVEQILLGRVPLSLLLLLLGGKMIASSLVIGSESSGGLFAPSLFVGACLGGVLGHLFNSLGLHAAPPGAYALVGMAGLVASTTQAPITSIIMIFELTRDYQIILPLMLAAVISHFISASITDENVFTITLGNGAWQPKSPPEPPSPGKLLVSDTMSEAVDAVRESMTLREAVEFMNQTKHNGLPVLDGRGRLVGMLTRSDVQSIPRNRWQDVTVNSAMSKDLVVTHPDEDLLKALHRLSFHQIGRLPVVERDDRQKLVGIITRTDIIAGYDALEWKANS